MMRCTSCDKPKAALKQKKSKAFNGVPWYACQDCLDNKREPRGYLILAGRQDGLEAIEFWLKPIKRYCGADITARELV